MRRLNPVLIMWLQTWGTLQQRNIGLEYPSITAEARLLHSPGRSSRQHFDPHYEPDQIDILVANAVRQLNSVYAKGLELKYVYGMSNRLIGKEIGTSEWGTRRLMERAVREIADVLEVEAYK